MLKTIFITTLKLLVATLLIGWLLKSGKLDFKLLAQLQHHLLEVLIAIALSIINFCLISYRWKNILQARTDVLIPLWGMLKITWIGQFFSSVLPGSVSGDLVKIIYVQQYDKNLSKKFVFASILIDRVMGLSALILLVGVSSALFSDHILENAPALAPVLKINYLIVGIVLIAFGIFTFFHQAVGKIFILGEKLFFPKLWQRFGNLWADLVSIRKKMVKALGISLIVQLVGVATFWSLIYPFVQGKMDFIQALAFIPLGLMTLALPVAPGGLGVGHAIFQKLFEFSGIDNGASLFNLYFVLTLVVNILGVIPYLLTRVKKTN